MKMSTTTSSSDPSVTDALALVMRALPGIGKDQQASQQQGGYAYRGIEQITRHVQPLFAEHGIVFTPHVVEWSVKDIVVNGKPWTDTTLLVEYTVHGPRGDSIKVGPILAVGRDNSDKGANKCMTQAFKYALLQTLCISDAKDDGDAQTHEADDAVLSAPVIRKPVQDSLLARLAALTDESREMVAAYFKDNQIPPIKRLPEDRLGDVEAMIELRESVEDEDAAMAERGNA